MSRKPLVQTVEAIERAMAETARREAREELSVVHYGAYDIHPRHLVYWLCVESDAEKLRLTADAALMRRLRDLLAAHGYPEEGRDEVHIGIESQETVDRESGGHWWNHWR